ncbi:MAG: Lysyl-tRNA synthetase [Microbacteriaceae bacterium]|jgi:phosphatidylglycerol lysyltransferase|nr:Lysyl-tRNA synthetase [Microbacteriaceae bacterium]
MIERLLRRHPATLGIVVLTFAGAILSRGFRGPNLPTQFALGTGYGQLVVAHRWWTPITSVFVTNGGIELALVAVSVVLVVGVAERLMGTARTVLAFAVTAVAGVIAGVVVQEIGNLLGELWSRRTVELVTLDPMTAVVGTIMTASAFAGPLWRRRIRVITSVVVLVFLLYAGDPSDLYRALAAAAGLALGAVLKPGGGPLRWQRSSHHEVRVLLSAVVAITAIGPAITVFSTLRLGPLAPLGLLLADPRPNNITAVDECRASDITRACLHDMTLERISGVGPILLTVLPLVALLAASLGIARGRRFAAILAIGLNVALAAIAALFYGFLPLLASQHVAKFRSTHYWEVSLALAVSVLLPLAIAGVLAANLRHLFVRASTRSLRRYFVVVAGSFVGLSVLYLAVGSAMRTGFRPRASLLDLAADLPDRFIPVGFLRVERLAFLPVVPLTKLLYYWIGPAFWVVVIVGALMVVLSNGSRESIADQARVRALLSAGSGSLGFWSTWAGNSYWFLPDGSAAVAYRVVNGVAFTTSDPIGPDDAMAEAIAGFARFCDDNAWTPVFYSVHEPVRLLCEEMGWQSIAVGDETVIRPGDWRTEGKRWQDIRSSINRAEREGVQAIWTSYASLTTAQAIQIDDMSERWVAEKELPEMGFTLGGVQELRDADVRMMIATDARGQVIGVTSWLPTWRDSILVGWTLDFMRRDPDGMNGIMEFLIARCAELFRDHGLEFMSLSAAPLASGGTTDETATERLLAGIGARLEPVYGFRSLFAFKRKFEPELRPLSMSFPDPLALPAVGIALGRAYLPDLSVRQSVRVLRGG